MLNAEAAKFVGFEPIDRDTMIAYVSSGLMQRGHSEEARMTAIESVGRAATEGMVYSLIRLNAPDRFGSGTTTIAYACAAEKTGCECFPSGEG